MRTAAGGTLSRSSHSDVIHTATATTNPFRALEPPPRRCCCYVVVVVTSSACWRCGRRSKGGSTLRGQGQGRRATELRRRRAAVRLRTCSLLTTAIHLVGRAAFLQSATCGTDRTQLFISVATTTALAASPAAGEGEKGDTDKWNGNGSPKGGDVQNIARVKNRLLEVHGCDARKGLALLRVALQPAGQVHARGHRVGVALRVGI